MQISFFEDLHIDRLKPLTLTRPVDDLRVGILTLGEKWKRALDVDFCTRMVRAELQGVFEAPNPDTGGDMLWINARYLPTESLLKQVQELQAGEGLKHGDVLVAANMDGETSLRWLDDNAVEESAPETQQLDDPRRVDYLWDLFLMNGEEIEADIKRMKVQKSDQWRRMGSLEQVYGDHIFISEGAVIEPGVVLIAEDGPIYIGADAEIHAGSIIKGPVAICEGSIVKMSSRVYDATTIGPVCKAAGEISNSIMHSYSNKAHDGYLGNSLIGQWCNLGADTVTSNLKNNYSPIKITDWSSREHTETGQQFLGTIMGDHCKTSINCMLNTGTVMGVSVNVATNLFPPKFLPSFTWYQGSEAQLYKFDKALETMRLMMRRRNVELTPAYQRMMQQVLVEAQSAQ